MSERYEEIRPGANPAREWCRACGVMVVDTAAHDRFHTVLEELLTHVSEQQKVR